jgi:hypothetical protein
LTRNLSSATAGREFILRVGQAASQQLKTILETKNLYQSVAVDYDDLYQQLASDVISHPSEKEAFRQHANVVVNRRLRIADKQLFEEGGGFPALTLLIQNVKLYCSHCKQRETFSPTSFVDSTDAIIQRHSVEHRVAPPPTMYQIFTLLYQCEVCRAVPVVYLVKFHDWKLIIEGRSPFGEVEVPDFIPKDERKLFSNAIVAAQTGHELAGVFYLRCFIEQFARRQTRIKDRQAGDAILAEYQSRLPLPQRDYMPSLRAQYETLSAAIHEATSDEALFNRVKEEIVRHFDFRRIFKIPDDSGAVQQSKAAADAPGSAG